MTPEEKQGTDVGCDHCRNRLQQAEAAAKALANQLREDTRRWRDSGLSLEAIRDLVNRWQSEDISFGKLVEELRLAASVAAADQAQSVLDGISRSLTAAVKGNDAFNDPAPLHWSQALKLACDEIEERDEALRLLATRVEAKRLDDAITERDEYRAKWLAVTNEYKPGWVQGLEAVARSVGYDPDKARHEGVEPPDFIQDVIERLQADNRYLRGSLSEIRSNIFQVLEERHEVYMLRHYLREAGLAAHRALDNGRKVP